MSTVGASLSQQLVATPRAPSSQQALLAQHRFVTLGDVNVSNYQRYMTANPAAMDAFAAAKTDLPAASLETTHAVIRVTLCERFLFVSVIADRVGRLEADVGIVGDREGQHFAGTYNTGVALAWMQPTIDEVLGG